MFHGFLEKMQMTISKPYGDMYKKNPHSPKGFRNAECGSHVALEKPLSNTGIGFRKISRIQNHFARS